MPELPETEPPIKRVSTVDAVAARIRELILSGQMAAGTELREAELATRYAVGRHSIRAAIQALTHQGLVRHIPHHGAFVPELSQAEVADLYTLRTAIELEATRKLARRPEWVDLPEAIGRALENLHRASSPDLPWSDVVEVDLAVHQALVEATDSPRMEKAYAAMIDELRLCLAHWPVEQRTSLYRADHQLIVEAIENRDVQRASELLERHLAHAADQIQRVLEQQSVAHSTIGAA